MSESDRRYFRVPCEFQLRFKKVAADEYKLFSSYALRPSPTSAARAKIENYVGLMDAKDGLKGLVETAVGILLNIDQRLERVEENILSILLDRKDDFVPYEWVSGEIGAQGVAFQWEEPSALQKGDQILVDMLLPDMPEHRIVAAALVADLKEDGELIVDFEAIHHDDQELIHRFVLGREREILRERARQKKNDPS